MELSDKYFALRAKKDSLEEELESLNAELGTAEQELIVWMENNQFQNFKDENNGTIYLRENVYARIEDEGKLFSYLKDNNMEGLIKETVNVKTLSAVVKEKGEIPGVIAHYQTKIGYRR